MGRDFCSVWRGVPIVFSRTDPVQIVIQILLGLFHEIFSFQTPHSPSPVLLKWWAQRTNKPGRASSWCTGWRPPRPPPPTRRPPPSPPWRAPPAVSPSATAPVKLIPHWASFDLSFESKFCYSVVKSCFPTHYCLVYNKSFDWYIHAKLPGYFEKDITNCFSKKPG